MKFTLTHDWIRIKEDQATIGITDYAQKELGEIVYIELPNLGHFIHAGEEAVVLESTKAAIDLYAPISGEVTAVNTNLKTDPQQINQSPYNEGWIYRLKIAQPEEIDQLIEKKDYLSDLEG